MSMTVTGFRVLANAIIVPQLGTLTYLKQLLGEARWLEAPL